jgi:hypothetical protein
MYFILFEILYYVMFCELIVFVVNLIIMIKMMTLGQIRLVYSHKLTYFSFSAKKILFS